VGVGGGVGIAMHRHEELSGVPMQKPCSLMLEQKARHSSRLHCDGVGVKVALAVAVAVEVDVEVAVSVGVGSITLREPISQWPHSTLAAASRKSIPHKKNAMNNVPMARAVLIRHRRDVGNISAEV
jgi:hypothetical protein